MPVMPENSHSREGGNPVSKMMNPRITSVQALANFYLLLGFTNGETRIFNVSEYIKNIPALQRLGNPVYFVRAHVAHGTVAWSAEEDICPDTLYLDSVPAEQKAA
jgi:hypothetical protein